MLEKLAVFLAEKLGISAATWFFAIFFVCAGAGAGGWFSGLYWRAKLAESQLVSAQQAAETSKARTAELSAALTETRRWQQAANQAEIKNAEIQKQIQVAALATDAADRRLREQLSATRAALTARLNTEAGTAMAHAALDVSGSCANEYRLMGSALAQCDAELTRVFGVFPPDGEKNE